MSITDGQRKEILKRAVDYRLAAPMREAGDSYGRLSTYLESLVEKPALLADRPVGAPAGPEQAATAL